MIRNREEERGGWQDGEARRREYGEINGVGTADLRQNYGHLKRRRKKNERGRRGERETSVRERGSYF